MTSAETDGIVLAHHGADDAAALLDGLCDAYADAYGDVPGEDPLVKTAAFRDRASAALSARNYDLVTAHADGALIGFVFGYSLRPERGWWDGLNPEPPAGFTTETGDRTVVLAEIEVRRAWQGSGVGRALHDEFLRTRTEERATLASGPNADAARALYERWGWQRAGTVPGKPGAYFKEYVRHYLPLPISSVR
jgi:ribosomal protein S18 acetylase RimI-like enzyme